MLSDVRGTLRATDLHVHHMNFSRVREQQNKLQTDPEGRTSLRSEANKRQPSQVQNIDFNFTCFGRSHTHSI